ncbi:ABC transporter permease [Haloechinothrix alba]|uniref:ABC transporter permease n=1 Tax=Haloechinothrix alba TaxID=664784 RepID=UPI001FEB1C3D|nr:ABC transporter permease [Haloechinothrix alba]
MTDGPVSKSNVMEGTKAGPLARAVESVGRVVGFSVEVIRDLPVALRLYPSEVFRRSGVLIAQNAVVVLFMVFMYGLLVGLALHAITSTIGIGSYVAAPHTIGNLRGVLETVFGWIFAAKVGCGIVAEMGAMRINDEIDAMEVMGIQSIGYLAGTRVLAALFVLPFLWTIALVVEFTGGYLFNVMIAETVSAGGFVEVFFLVQNARDFIASVGWATLVGVVVTLVSCYYGYNVRGGPVNVGRNTAKAMLVNLVAISVIMMLLVQLLYGNDPNTPMAN